MSISCNSKHGFSILLPWLQSILSRFLFATLLRIKVQEPNFQRFCRICQQSFKSVIAIVHSPHSTQIPATFQARLFPVRKGFRPKLNFRRQSFGIFRHSYVAASWQWLWNFYILSSSSSSSFLFQIICKECLILKSGNMYDLRSSF